MVKYIETTRRLLPTNCLSVFDHFVGLALTGLILEILLPDLICLKLSIKIPDFINFFPMFSFDTFKIFRKPNTSDVFRGIKRKRLVEMG